MSKEISIQEEIIKIEGELSSNSAAQLKLQAGSPREIKMKQDYLKLMMKKSELTFNLLELGGYKSA